MADIQTRLAGALADRYRIEREVGSGGLATVYHAHDLKHERDVALKVLHPELGAVTGAAPMIAAAHHRVRGGGEEGREARAGRQASGRWHGGMY